MDEKEFERNVDDCFVRAIFEVSHALRWLTAQGKVHESRSLEVITLPPLRKARQLCQLFLQRNLTTVKGVNSDSGTGDGNPGVPVGGVQGGAVCPESGTAESTREGGRTEEGPGAPSQESGGKS